jgi:protein O-GlcNAc transferase
MLLNVLRRLAEAGRSAENELVPDAGLLEYASELTISGDKRGAIKAYRDYLRTDPSNTRALNDLGACLADIGDLEQASASFELAYSLDDTFIPAMVNHAKLLVDNNRGQEALVFLERARICAPDFKHTDNVYAGLLMRHGDIDTARKFQLKAWLSDFDNLRSANANLFWVGYDDVQEETIAGEHRFWAETVKPIPDAEWQPALAPLEGRRIRIGYWSPDLRNHSVRYFFRPLLENQDRQRFEVILYHDFPGRDAQTGLMEGLAADFHEVHDLMDLDLRDLIRSHQLDILVDLAGHTSHNRMSLLQCRMAKLQINAIGYPPTTGLPSVDYKLLDRHVVTKDAARFYAERPLVLPDSFWCFDPMEDAPPASEPPMVANGRITFGAVGNVSKISERIAAAWAQILAAVPNSRLLVRSVTFVDPTCLAATRRRLAGWGLPTERIDFRAPEGGAAFFTSYNEIDIILDTFPFNGGTTSCFATYMGVPLVAIAGESLISRMALSMLTTLGFADLAVTDVPSYIARAIALANDPERVRLFKHTARERFLATSLGNGALFARDFEAACALALADDQTGQPPRENRLAVLPEAEIVRRAYAVLGADQAEAAQRVLRHCLQHYPNAGAAHLLWAQILVWGGLVGEAIGYLSERVDTFSSTDQVSSWISIVRMRLLQRDLGAARDSMARLGSLAIEDAFDAAQLRLYRACAQVIEGTEMTASSLDQVPGTSLHIVVPSDSIERFQLVREQFERTCVLPTGCSLAFTRCSESQRIGAYRKALAGPTGSVVVLLQKNVEIHQPRFVQHVLQALDGADCVGSSGAKRWLRLDWRSDEFGQKAGGFVSPSSEKQGLHDLHVVGLGTQIIVPGMDILDGAVLAVRVQPGLGDGFDDNLLGCETLLEESWSNALARAGKRLAVHRNLGVYLAGVELDGSNRSEARMECARQMEFRPFEFLKADQVSLSTPTASAAEAVRVADAYFSGTD